MVASNREIASKHIFSSPLAMSTSIKSNTASKDINIDESRERSMSSSLNTSKKSLAHSNLSFVLYMDRMEVQSKDPIGKPN